MNISIIGAGNVGYALTTAFVQLGHRIIIGVRDTNKYAGKFTRFSDEQVHLTSVDKAISVADVVVFATPYAAALDVASGIQNWSNKIIIDATNPLTVDFSALQLGTTTSGAEVIAGHAHNARVVKAFNSTGSDNMSNSQYPKGQIVMPIAGDDVDAKKTVLDLANSIGFDTVDAGQLSAARHIEPLAMLWIHMAFQTDAGLNWGWSRVKR